MVAIRGERRPERDEAEPPAVQDIGRIREHHRGNDDQRDGTDPRDEARVTGDEPGRDERGNRAEEKRLGPRVGAVVDAQRILARVVEQRHRRGRRDRARERDQREREPPTAAEREQARENERPHQIELLLDCERPQVHEWRVRADRSAVRHTVDDEPPVGHVAEGGETL